MVLRVSRWVGGRVMLVMRVMGMRMTACRRDVHDGHVTRGVRRMADRIACRRQPDTIDRADIGDLLALQPRGRRGQQRHAALQDERGSEGPERQARGEAGAMRHGVIVSESQWWVEALVR